MKSGSSGNPPSTSSTRRAVITGVRLLDVLPNLVASLQHVDRTGSQSGFVPMPLAPQVTSGFNGVEVQGQWLLQLTGSGSAKDRGHRGTSWTNV